MKKFLPYRISSLIKISNWRNRIYCLKITRRLNTTIYGRKPANLKICDNAVIQNPQHVAIGDDCFLGMHAAICPLHCHLGTEYPSNIVIGNRVHIGSYDRIASAYSVTIEDDVLFAAFVHITDHSHGYEDILKPISKQKITYKGPVRIGKGSWLSFGCHILSGVTIGEHCVVAANAVVTKDVPAYSIVAGNPARIVKQYNFETNRWERP